MSSSRTADETKLDDWINAIQTDKPVLVAINGDIAFPLGSPV